MGEKKDLPPGFRFYPEDEEVITFYLKPKILGQKLSSNVVRNIELYGPNSTPWRLFDVNDNDSWTEDPGRPSEKFLYVFTTLSKVGSSHKKKGTTSRENTSKKAGCGTWNAKTSRKLIRDRKGNLIGERRQLLFEINEIGDQFDFSKAGYFKMHEFSLCGVNKGLKSADGVGDIVLCKITFDSSKKPILKLSSKSTDHVSKGQKKEENNNENLEASVGGNLEGKWNLTLEIMVMNDGVGGKNLEGTRNLMSELAVLMNDDVGDNNLEGTGNLMSELAVLMNDGVSDFEDCQAAADQFFQYSNEFGGDLSFDTDWLIGVLSSNQKEGPVEDITRLGKRIYEEENLNGTKKLCLRGLMWKEEFYFSYVGFMKDGAKWLVDNTDIKLVGIDYLSVAADDDLIPAHLVFFEGREVILVEGLKLDGVKAGIYNVHCLPLRLVGAEGSPIRCILMK